jgi:hypothetical protein
MTALYTYSDGSVLKTMNMKTFLGIPVWKGNRHIDVARVDLLAKEVGDAVTSLDSGYHVIIQEEDMDGKPLHQAYLINGQHRREVLLRHYGAGLCLPDFPMTYTEKVVHTESETIAYFNRINNMKPFHVEEDSRCVANRFVAALEKGFPKGLIRAKTTRRPYLSADTLREELEKYSKVLQSIDPAIFVEKVRDYNKKRLAEMELEKALGKPIPDSYKEKEFTLAEHLKWVRLVVT